MIPWLVSDFRIFVGVPIYALSNIIHYVPSSSTDTKELLLNSTQTLWTAEELYLGLVFLERPHGSLGDITWRKFVDCLANQ